MDYNRPLRDSVSGVCTVDEHSRHTGCVHRNSRNIDENNIVPRVSSLSTYVVVWSVDLYHSASRAPWTDDDHLPSMRWSSGKIRRGEKKLRYYILRATEENAWSPANGTESTFPPPGGKTSVKSPRAMRKNRFN